METRETITALGFGVLFVLALLGMCLLGKSCEIEHENNRKQYLTECLKSTGKVLECRISWERSYDAR